MKLNKQKGIGSMLMLMVMALFAVAIPVTTNLVQKNQENRSKAAEDEVILKIGTTNEQNVGSTLIMVPTRGPTATPLLRLTPTPLPNSIGMTEVINIGVTEVKPYLSFSPAKGNFSNNKDFEIIVRVDSKSKLISAVDIVSNYDSSILELISAKQAPSMVFGDKGFCVVDSISGGKFSASCAASDLASGKAVKGDLLVLTFRPKTNGNAKIEFVCEKGNTIDSNIVESKTKSDLIDCISNINGSYTVSSVGLTKINGACGSPNGLLFTSRPQESELCKFGKLITGAYPKCISCDYLFSWVCEGIGGGKDAKCSAKIYAKSIIGKCGTANGSYIVPSNVKNISEIKWCALGKRGSVSFNAKLGKYFWICKGTDGNSVSCSAKVKK